MLAVTGSCESNHERTDLLPQLPGLRESLKRRSILSPIASILEKGLGKAHEVAHSMIAPRRENDVHELFHPQQGKCMTLR